MAMPQEGWYAAPRVVAESAAAFVAAIAVNVVGAAVRKFAAALSLFAPKKNPSLPSWQHPP